MWEFFGFPDKFKVKKSLDKTQFLNHANLTAVEETVLRNHLVQIRLLYDIKFADNSEMIVVHTTAKLPEYRDQYFLQDYARAIAQSFPYHCLIALQYHSSVKLILPETRQNSKNDHRMFVEQVWATPLVPTDEYSLETGVLKEMNESIRLATSSDELQALWIKDIIGISSEDSAKRYAWDGVFFHEREEYAERLRPEKRFEESISVASLFLDKEELIREAERITTEFDKENYDEEQATAIDQYETALQVDFCECEEYIEFFQSYCWPLYEMARKDRYRRELNPGDWLREYCYECNDMLNNEHGRYLTPVEIREIAIAFSEHRSVSVDTMPYELAVLKERLYINEEAWTDDFSEDDGIEYEDSED